MDEQPVAESTKVATTNTTTTIQGVTPYEHSVMPGVIAIILTIGLLLFAAVLLLYPIPEVNIHLIDMLFGGLIVGCTTAWNYYYTTNQASDARAAVRVSKE